MAQINPLRFQMNSCVHDNDQIFIINLSVINNRLNTVLFTYCPICDKTKNKKIKDHVYIKILNETSVSINDKYLINFNENVDSKLLQIFCMKHFAELTEMEEYELVEKETYFFNVSEIRKFVKQSHSLYESLMDIFDVQNIDKHNRYMENLRLLIEETNSNQDQDNDDDKTEKTKNKVKSELFCKFGVNCKHKLNCYRIHSKKVIQIWISDKRKKCPNKDCDYGKECKNKLNCIYRHKDEDFIGWKKEKVEKFREFKMKNLIPSVI